MTAVRGRMAGLRLVPALAALAALILAAAPAQALRIERVVSPLGIEAWLVRGAKVPVVAVHFAFVGGGASQDPEARPGVAGMVAALLGEGAGDLDAAAFQERVEEQAAQLDFAADRDHFHGSLRVLSENRDAAFDLLRLALTAPRFDADAVARVRAQTEARLREESADPIRLADKAWWQSAFPGHPYGRPPEGTLDSVAAIGAAELRAFRERVLARDLLKVAIVGDIDAAAAAAMLDRVFGGLPAKATLVPVAAAMPARPGSLAVVAFDAPQAAVAMGAAGLAAKHPDYMAATVVNHILGGGIFTSRLFYEVREKRGLAYYIETKVSPLHHAALIMTEAQMHGDRAGRALALIEQEIRRMAEGGPTAEELADAKEYLTGSHPLRFDSSADIADRLLQAQLEGRDIGHINRHNAEVEAVTLEDARRAARTVLSAPFVIVVVGRPAGVEPRPGNPG